MKTFLTLLCSFFMLAAFAQTAPAPDPNKKIILAEVSCGQCKLGLPGKSCDLAVRIDGKAWFVDGTAIDDHGDAHAKDGFCNAIRKAEVQGEVIDGRFRATWFKVLPAEKKN